MTDLREIFQYDPETGNIYWKIRKQRRGGFTRPGDIAGTRTEGRIQIKFEGKFYKAHRLAWFLQTGEWPENDIDHEDNNGFNNRWKNLRKATRSQNNRNGNNKLRSDNKSGIRGVSFRKDTGKWHARFYLNGKAIMLGDFVELEDATKARRSAEAQYGF